MRIANSMQLYAQIAIISLPRVGFGGIVLLSWAQTAGVPTRRECPCNLQV